MEALKSESLDEKFVILNIKHKKMLNMRLNKNGKNGGSYVLKWWMNRNGEKKGIG